MKRFLLFFTFASIIFSCSKDRIEADQPQTEKETPEQVIQNDSTITDSVILEINWKEISIVKNNNTPDKSVKTVNSNADLPIYGDKGTAFYPYNYIFEDANGNDVEYPITLEIIELYTPKDMILADIPSTSNGELLVSGGEFFVKAYKDGQEIFIKKFSHLSVQVPSNNPDWNMDVFVNKTNTDEFNDWVPADEATWVDPDLKQEAFFIWTNDTINTGGVRSPGYQLSLSSLGWINCDYFRNVTGTKTAINFTSEIVDMKYIQTYLYVPSANSIMSVYGTTSGQIPVGETLKAICFAVDSDEKVHYMVKEFTVENGHTVDVVLKEGTQADFETVLENL